MFRTHVLTFHLVHPDGERIVDAIPEGFRLARFAGRSSSLVVATEPVLQDAVEDADVSFLADGKPGVSVVLTNEATYRLRRLAADKTGYRLAILLDGEVFSAPTIREPPNEKGIIRISGDFTVREAQDLAVVLRSGGIPVPVAFVAGRSLR